MAVLDADASILSHWFRIVGQGGEGRNLKGSQRPHECSKSWVSTESEKYMMANGVWIMDKARRTSQKVGPEWANVRGAQLKMLSNPEHPPIKFPMGECCVFGLLVIA